MAGRGNQTGPGVRDSVDGYGYMKRLPTLTEGEKDRRRKELAKERARNKKEHWETRKLETVARGIAAKMPEFANATQILAQVEDISEHLTSFMNAGMVLLGESFPELVAQSVEKALDQYDDEGRLVREGDASERRFLIQKMIDLKPLVEGGSMRNNAMMDKMKSLLEEDGTSVVATERTITVSHDPLKERRRD